MEIEIKEEFIKLGNLLKLANIVSSGGEAKNIIFDGEVYVNGEVEYQRGKKIKKGDIVKVFNETVKIV